MGMEMHGNQAAATGRDCSRVQTLTLLLSKPRGSLSKRVNNLWSGIMLRPFFFLVGTLVLFPLSLSRSSCWIWTAAKGFDIRAVNPASLKAEQLDFKQQLIFAFPSINFNKGVAAVLLPSWPAEKYVVMSAAKHSSLQSSIVNAIAAVNTTGEPGSRVELSRLSSNCRGVVVHINSICLLVARVGVYPGPSNRTIVVGTATSKVAASDSPPSVIDIVVPLRTEHGSALFPDGGAVVLAQVQQTSAPHGTWVSPNVAWTNQNRDVLIRVPCQNVNNIINQDFSLSVGYVAVPQGMNSTNDKALFLPTKTPWVVNQKVQLNSVSSGRCHEPLLFVTPELQEGSHDAFIPFLKYEQNLSTVTANIIYSNCSTNSVPDEAMRLGVLKWHNLEMCGQLTAYDLKIQLPEKEIEESSPGVNYAMIYTAAGAGAAVVLFAGLVFYCYNKGRKRPAAQLAAARVAPFSMGPQLLASDQPQNYLGSMGRRPGVAATQDAPIGA